MKIDFAGKKAIVCGGSRGIGKAIALGFAACGGDVSICARDPKALEETRAEIARLGRKAHAASADLSQGDAVRGYVREAVGALGGVDFLVNNASAFGASDDDKGWTSNLAVDILSIVHATQEALPALKKSQGSVVNISSIAAHHPAARQPPYGAIKAAVIHYTVTQAAMYAKDRIRVNCIAPGSIEFPGGVWDRRKTDNPALYNATLASIPFGRMGYAEEIANVALFLASPLASWVTGQASTSTDSKNALTRPASAACSTVARLRSATVSCRPRSVFQVTLGPSWPGCRRSSGPNMPPGSDSIGTIHRRSATRSTSEACSTSAGPAARQPRHQ